MTAGVEIGVVPVPVVTVLVVDVPVARAVIAVLTGGSVVTVVVGAAGTALCALKARVQISTPKFTLCSYCCIICNIQCMLHQNDPK